MKRYRTALLIGIVVAAFPVLVRAQNPCEAPKSQSERVACVGKELRQSDGKINEIYKELMPKLSASGKTQLRSEQRAWLKKRTSACSLNDKETDRNRWMAQILKDYSTTVCVVRWTNERIRELEAYRPAAEDNAQPLPTEETYVNDNSDEYRLTCGVERSKGKWYFEVWFDKGNAEFNVDAVIAVAVESDQTAGIMARIRKRDRGTEPITVGLAVDLDNGMVYTSENGDWQDTEPGSSNGLTIRLNRSYKAIIDSSVAMTDLIRKGLIKVNFGKNPFKYAMPNGYSPFQEH